MTINQEVLKSVCTFDVNRPIGQVRSFYENVIYPQLETALRNQIESFFTDFVIENSFDIVKRPPKEYDGYPKIVISGETTLTIEELNAKLNLFYDEAESIAQTVIVNQGGIVKAFHTHRYL